MFYKIWTKSVFCSRIKNISAYYKNIDFAILKYSAKTLFSI